MPVNLFTFVDLYTRLLDSAAHILKKGVEHAKATGVSEQDMLDWRLIDDMQPLRFQLSVVCNFARQWPARVVGLPLPEEIGIDFDVAGFQKEIAASREVLAALTPQQFEGRDDVPLKVSLAGGQMEPTLPASRWLSVCDDEHVFPPVDRIRNSAQQGRSDRQAGSLLDRSVIRPQQPHCVALRACANSGRVESATHCASSVL